MPRPQATGELGVTGHLSIGVEAARLRSLAARATEKLRHQHSTALEVCVFIITNRFRAQDLQYQQWVSVPLIQPSNDTILITRAALHGLRSIYLPGLNYKKAGVILREIG
ncbi:hypothetical protein OL229_04335 [Neisseriaceae bacterium JH1-16]|nr:hypothetical protein [Neisseriaceae bacterium JH1-16]